MDAKLVRFEISISVPVLNYLIWVCHYPILNTLQMDAKLHADHLTKVIDLALQGTEQVHAILDGIVKEKLKESSMLS
jgi:hypothetical protein